MALLGGILCRGKDSEWRAALGQQMHDGDRRIEGRLVSLDQQVNGPAERIARVEGPL